MATGVFHFGWYVWATDGRDLSRGRETPRGQKTARPFPTASQLSVNTPMATVQGRGRKMTGRRMRRRMYSESGFALVSAMIFLVVLLIVGASLVQTGSQELQTASRVRKESRALNLAEAGVDYAAWKLYYNPTQSLPVTWSRSDLGTGSFSVTASPYVDPGTGNPVANTVVVESTGASQGWPSQVKVVGRFLVHPGDNNPIFDNALFSNADLDLKGTADINGTIACNGNLTLSGSPAVDGDARASGSITGKVGNITGSKTAFAPKVPMPTIDLAYYRSIATTIVSSGYSFNGNTALDGITYVDGDCSVNSRFSGTGIIVCSGTVTVNGSATVESLENDSLAIVSAGGVRVNGNSTIQGFIYTHNLDVPAGFLGNGTADITGGVVADVITANGTINVTYKKPTQSLPGANSDPTQFAAISWRRVK
jgi:cytoskeletal protein CcmA (bactofilin family)